MTRYVDAHKAGWRSQKHTDQWVASLVRHADSLMELPVADIKTASVLQCLEPIWTTKTITATRVRQRIESVLDWATARKYRSGENPARWRGHLDTLLAKPSSLKTVKHRPALPYKNMATFMAKLRGNTSMAAKVLELQILCAVRPGESSGAMWAEIDIVDNVWTIPAERMKSKKQHTIPLSPAAVNLLKSLPRVTDFVFPGNRLDKGMTAGAARDLLKRIEPEVTAHGFRSSFRDWAADQTAYPREIIEHAMAHKLKDAAEAAYFRSDMLVKRSLLMAAWSDYCDHIPVVVDNVIGIRKEVQS